jgi:hypothetical protein
MNRHFCSPSATKEEKKTQPCIHDIRPLQRTLVLNLDLRFYLLPLSYNKVQNVSYSLLLDKS